MKVYCHVSILNLFGIDKMQVSYRNISSFIAALLNKQ